MEGIMCEKGFGVLRKINPPPFLVKTYMLVDDPASDTIISWNDDGTGFVVWQPAEFARDFLPTHFKHSNFSSFVRQLNTYGFRKVATSRWEFCNDMFQRGKKELLPQIRRRKAWTHRQQPAMDQAMPQRITSTEDPQNHNTDQRSSSTSSSSELNILVDENKRLKKENGVLCSELSTLKRRCTELLKLVAIYTNLKGDKQETDDDANDKAPMLFGVRLGRREEEKTMKKKAAETDEMSKRLLLSQSCK